MTNTPICIDSRRQRSLSIKLQTDPQSGCVDVFAWVLISEQSAKKKRNSKSNEACETKPILAPYHVIGKDLAQVRAPGLLDACVE